MIAIKIDKKNVKLDDDFSFSITRENPLFNDPETLSGDYIESMTFSTEGNEAIFKNVNRITSNTKIKDLPIEIFWNGMLINEGTFTVKSIGNSFVTGDSKLNAVDFFYQIREKKLNDIDYSYTINNLIGLMNSVSNLNEEDATYEQDGETISLQGVPFRFPVIYGDKLYSEGDNTNKWFNYFDAKLDTHILSYVKNGIVLYSGVSPCFKMWWILLKIIKESFYSTSLRSTLFSDRTFTRLLLLTNITIDKIQKGNQKTTAKLYGYDYIYYPPFYDYSVTNYRYSQKEDGVFFHVSGNQFICKYTGSYKFKFKDFLFLRNVDGHEGWGWVQVPMGVPSTHYITPNVFVVNTYTRNGERFYCPLNENQFEIVEKSYTWEGEEVQGRFYNFECEIDANEGDVFGYQWRLWFDYDTPFKIYGDIEIEQYTIDYSSFYDDKITTQKVLPPELQLDFFKSVRMLFGVSFFVNSKKREIEILTANEILDKQAIDFGYKINKEYEGTIETKALLLAYANSKSLQEKEDILKFENIDDFPEHTWEVDSTDNYFRNLPRGTIMTRNENNTGWNFFTYDNYNYQELDKDIDNEITFENSFDLVEMTQMNEWLCPEIKATSVSNITYDKYYMKPMVALYIGKDFAFTDASHPYEAPLASWSNINKGNGIQSEHPELGQGYVTPFRALRPQDLHELYFIKFENFIKNSKFFKFSFRIPIADFINLRLQEKYTCNGFTFFIKTMKMTINTHDYSDVEMEVYVF